MKKHTLIKLFTLVMSVALLSSCVSYKHSYRMSETDNFSALNVADGYLVDIEIDFKKKVSSTSTKQKTARQAKEEAYYNAIMENNIDIVVDPIYKIKTSRGFFGSKSIADISGYSGFYKNVRSVSDQKASDFKMSLAEEKAIFKMRNKNIDELSKNKILADEENNTYLIDSREEKCCGSKNSKNQDTYGGTHLLHTNKNSIGIIEHYKNLVGITSFSKTSSNSKTGISSKSKETISFGKKKGKKLFSKKRSK